MNKQNDNFFVQGQKPLDAKRLNPLGQPWASVSEVNSTIIIGNRSPYLEVIIGDKTYWYAGTSLSDASLVEKLSGIDYVDSETIDFTSTTANLKDGAVTAQKMADFPTNTILGNLNAAGIPQYLTKTQLQTFVDFADKTDKGGYSGTSQDLATSITTLGNDLRGGVVAAGDTLAKLYALILGASGQKTVNNITERDAYDAPLGTQVFVIDDYISDLDPEHNDHNWALYKAITAGVGATYVKLSDPDLLNAAMSSQMIKASYESNPDTYAFTYNEKTAVASIVNKEDKINKVDNLDDDGTGTKYPTVDAINEFVAKKADLTTVKHTFSFPVMLSGGKNFGQYLNSDIATFTDLTVPQIIQQIGQEVISPVLVAPTYDITLPNSTQREVGSTYSETITSVFNRGAVNGMLVSGSWSPGTSQGFRAGAATTYVIDGTAPQAGSSLAVNRVLDLGPNNFNANVNHGVGIQPKNSLNANYSTPLAAGNVAAAQKVITADYPVFYGTLTPTQTINDIDLSTFTKMTTINANNNITIPFNNVIDKQLVIIIPSEKTTKTKWFVDALNKGNIGGIGDLFATPVTKNYDSPNSFWLAKGYKVYISVRTSMPGDMQIQN